MMQELLNQFRHHILCQFQEFQSGRRQILFGLHSNPKGSGAERFQRISRYMGLKVAYGNGSAAAARVYL